jgi:hypothetical protein
LLLLEDAALAPLPQQEAGPSSQPQVGSFLPRNAAWIIAWAQPTPLSTSIAPVGQLS